MVQYAERYIPDVGPEDATVYFIGESPGRKEHAQGVPFVGFAGKKLDEWLEIVGVDRNAVKIMNVYPFYPRSKGYAKTDDAPLKELRQYGDAMLERLRNSLPAQPCGQLRRVIVPMGNLAVNCLLGFNLKAATITNYRGSIMEFDGWPVVPTFHPAYILRSPQMEEAVMHDLEKIKDLLAGVDRRPPHRDYHTWKPGDVVAVPADTAMLSVDIETFPKDGVMDCIGFSHDPLHAITVPTWYPDYNDKLQHEGSLETVKTVCESGVPKVVQSSGFYDPYWLRKRYGIELHNVLYNTYWMSHCLNPGAGGGASSETKRKDRKEATGGHRLSYLASLWTDEPYWKDESDPSDRPKRLRYNCKDAAIQCEIAGKLKAELERQGKWWLYKTYYLALYEPLFETMCHGIRVNRKRRKARLKACKAAAAKAAERLEELCGEPLIARVALSDDRLRKYLYAPGRIPQPKPGRGRKKPSVDQYQLRRIIHAMQMCVDSNEEAAQIAEVCQLVLDFRGVTKDASTFLADKIEDKDGRVRCDYKLVPETNRISSGTNPMGGGMNLQNVKRELRDIFEPDEGCVIVKLDYSTAEDRVVKLLSGDPEMIRKALTKPWEYSAHYDNASLMFDLPYAQIDKETYDITKRVGHGSNYDMGAETLSDQMLKMGIVRTPEESALLMALYRSKAMPALETYHDRVIQKILLQRQLTNSWGTSLDFRFARMDHETYKRGFAYRPQSEVGIMLNQCGFIPMYWWLKGQWQRLRARINLQLHDGIYISTPPQHAYEVALMGKTFMEQERVYDGVAMTIPVSIQVGPGWDQGPEFDAYGKERFTKEAFEAAAFEAFEGLREAA